jgi:hypothetical protein
MDMAHSNNRHYYISMPEAGRHPLFPAGRPGRRSVRCHDHHKEAVTMSCPARLPLSLPTRWLRLLPLLAILLVATGCALSQKYSSVRHDNLGLSAGDLEAHGIAFVSPSAITGREEDKPGLALIFAQVLREQRPGVAVMGLSETLGRVNEAGLAEDYFGMYEDYADTGLFRREALATVGQVTGHRYLAQLKLASFEQGSSGRFGALGWRLIDTKLARVRLFFQIWDSQTGSIAWEGVNEMALSNERIEEQLVTFAHVVQAAALDLIQRLP